MGNLDEAVSLLNQAIEKFPGFDKFYMIKGQIDESKGQVVPARDAFEKGRKACSRSAPLWILAARLEESTGSVIRARSLLERGRLLNPKVPDLWQVYFGCLFAEVLVC